MRYSHVHAIITCTCDKNPARHAGRPGHGGWGPPPTKKSGPVIFPVRQAPGPHPPSATFAPPHTHKRSGRQSIPGNGQLRSLLPVQRVPPAPARDARICRHRRPRKRDWHDRCPDRQRQVERGCRAPRRAKRPPDRHCCPDGQPAHDVCPGTRARKKEAADLKDRVSRREKEHVPALAAKGT